LYPNYNTSPVAADATGMTSTAMQISKKITLGINIGNTLEAFGCVPATETCWGNPKVTEAYVKAVKNAGFSLIRLPVSWDQYANQSTGKIDEVWLNRIKEVVRYCVDNDVYVMVNIHWDGGWLENNILKGKQAAIQAKQKAFWEQIATTLRDFDEHVILASANEPNVENAEGLQELNIYHQTFIDAVR
jgi:aryl-phospho-beta-D-glucosidase BglC (GH1 family)